MSARESQLDMIFHALSDQTRRKLLLKIAEKEHRVTDLAFPFEMSLNGISKHLKILETAGLLKRTVEGRVHRCRADLEPLDAATQTIAHYKAFWESQLSSIERFLTQTKKNRTKKTKRKTSWT